jgi:hypothetical protein
MPISLGRVWALPWHPFLLTIAFLANPLLLAGIEPAVGARAFGVALVGMAALLAAARIATGAWQRAGLAASGVAAILATKPWLVPTGIALTLAHPLASALICVAGIASAYLAGRLIRRSLRRPGGYAQATSALNVFGVILLVLVAFNGFDTLSRASGAHVPMPPQPAETTKAPDVYVLLLDGYPRADVLGTTWGYDNSSFLAALEERGFAISDRSRANYLTTRLTFATMLNMRLAHRLPGYRAIRDGAPTQPIVLRMIRESLVLAQLRAAGYRITATAPGIEIVSLRDVDRWEEGPHLNEFEYRVLEATWLTEALRLLAPDYLASEHRGRIEYGFDAVRRAAEAHGADDTPDLVWAHIASPHMPPVFGPRGEPIPVSYRWNFFGDTGADRDMENEEFRAAFRGNLEHLNELILDTLDSILAHSSAQPVVIVMSDHGSGTEFDYGDMLNSDITSRAGTLFAALTPGHPQLFGESTTPVNLFPQLFNAYLGTDYPLSPNTTYVNTPGGVRAVVADDGADAR